MKSYKKTIYKRKAKKSFFKKRWFWDLVLFLLLLGSSSWLLFKTPYFEIKEIKISAREDFVEKIKEVASSQKNFFLFNSEKVSQEIESYFPQIKNAKIKKNFPDKIFIEAEERKEIGIFCNNNNNLNCFSIASDAVIFSKREFQSTEDGLILFLKPTEQQNFVVGNKIFDEKKFLQILFFLDKLKEVNIVAKRVEIYPFEIKIFTSTNLKIYLSALSDIKQQALSFINVYQNTISDEEKINLDYVDLRGLEGGVKGGVYWK